MILVTHPDDETIGMGAQLCRFTDALLVHATDGAPRDGRDALDHGFTSIDAYAAARQAELGAALAVGNASGIRVRHLGIADQHASYDLVTLTSHLADLLR